MHSTFLSLLPPAPVAQVIMGEDGTDTGRRKLDSLRENSNFMRRELINMGLHVYGNFDSPVIPVSRQ